MPIRRHDLEVRGALIRRCTMRLASLLMTLFFVACGDDSSSKQLDMCVDTNVFGGACNQPYEVVMGNCFESSRCVCVSPEAIWVCCYGGRDAPGLRIGDPCCGPGAGPNWNTPGGSCYCDDTHHWACFLFDLGTTD